MEHKGMTNTATEAVERLSESLDAAYEWVRAPDWEDAFSTDTLLSWLDDRPSHAIHAAPATIRALAAERDALRALVEKYEARLEIDHVFKVDAEGNSVRMTTSPEERGEVPDAVDCRDATIELLKEDLAERDTEIARLKAKLAETWNTWSQI